MSTRLAGFGLIVAFLIAAPGGCGPQNAHAGTIQDLVDNDGGVITVGPFTFSFTATSVTGDRTAAQVSVAPVDSNGLEFTINPGMRLDSNAQGSQTLKIGINYTVTAAGPFSGASLSDDAFAQNTANGASAGVTETLNGTDTLYVGTQPPAKVPSIVLAGTETTLTVANAGNLFVPVRGAAGDADEAQLNSITNTFSTVPEPSTLVMAYILIGLFGAVCSCKRLKETSLTA